MTLPFENDTKTIIKRISSRNISANRKRNFFIIITITLASTLLSAITLYGFGITQKTKNLNKKTAQIVYHALVLESRLPVGSSANTIAKISKYAVFGKVTNCGR